MRALTFTRQFIKHHHKGGIWVFRFDPNSPADATECEFIILVNDLTLEGDETFMVVLSNPINGFLGTPSTAEVTIQDDELRKQKFISCT